MMKADGRMVRRGRGRVWVWVLRAAILLGVLLVGACGGGSGGGDGVVAVQVDNGQLTVVVVSDCPPCDAAAMDRAYGRFSFVSNLTNQTAQSILNVCGFQTVRGHAGIGGDTFQIAGCSGGLEFAFVSNRFQAFAVRSGFSGTFNAAIRIGDSLDAVLAADPRFVQVDPLTFVRDDGTVRVEANFDTNLRLRELVVGRGFLR